MKRIAPEFERLAAELRGLRARTGLSLAALGTGSAYSKSSWERYLNGKSLPPWPAVRALCRLADEPEPRIRALWELAEQAWSGRAAVAPPPRTPGPEADRPDRPPPTALPEPAAEPSPGPAPEAGTEPAAAGPTARRPPRHPRAAAVPVALAAAVALPLLALLGWFAHQWLAAQGQVLGSHPDTAITAFRVGCHGSACEGQDPTAMLCGVQPLTLAEFPSTDAAGLEIRYNPQCGAAWTRVWDTRAGDEITITAPGQPTRSARVPDAQAADAFLYTPMVALGPRGTPLRACVVPPSAAAPQCFTVRAP